MRTFVSIIDAKTAERNSGWVLCRMGPTCTPCKTRADIITAAAVPPGMPSAKSGTIEPPAAALLAVSDAAIPSMAPWPNCFLFGEILASVE